MQVLAVDVGTGTQDILLYDSDREIENCLKLVMPSATLIVARQVKQATRAGRPIVLTGVTMGGGPSAWATMDHIRAGYTVYATPEAARTFDDELEKVESQGISLVSDDEAAQLGDDVARVPMRDFDFDAIRSAFGAFGIRLQPDALALAVFDHGNAPPGYSDRQFRFDYLQERIRAQNRLSAFAFRRGELPHHLTRLRAVEATANFDGPLMLMDTAPAAVLGALADPNVAARESLWPSTSAIFMSCPSGSAPPGSKACLNIIPARSPCRSWTDSSTGCATERCSTATCSTRWATAR